MSLPRQNLSLKNFDTGGPPPKARRGPDMDGLANPSPLDTVPLYALAHHHG